MFPKLDSEAQRRAWLALSDDWRAPREIAGVAGISAHGAGMALAALVRRGVAERRDGGRGYVYRRVLSG